MRKIILLLSCASFLLAKSYLSSPIAIPKNRIFNLEVEKCSTHCLSQRLKEEEIFSFLSYMDDQSIDSKLKESMMIYASYFNLDRVTYEIHFRVAMLIPDKIIGKYAVSTNNAVFAYLLAKNRSFDLKAYYIDDESQESIDVALEKIMSDGYSYVIAPMTLKGAAAVASHGASVLVYFPTINKKDIPDAPETLFFGGIDYEAQTEKLLEYSQGYMGLFYDPSSLGQRLNKFVEDSVDPKWIRFSTSISRKHSNLEKYLKHNDLLQNGTIFVNTSTVNSGIALSQLTLYDIEPAAILSTQINFDPLILSMTQTQDRKNMYIANSIEGYNNVLIEANRLLDNNIVYDRINYATMLGIDYFLSMVSREKREYREPMEGNQIKYPINIYKPSQYGFIKIN